MRTNVYKMEIKMTNQVPDVVDDLVKALDSKVIKALTATAMRSSTRS